MSKMKRALLLCGIAVATVLALCVTTACLGNLFEEAGVVMGPLIMLAAVPMHMLGKRWPALYAVGMVENLFGTTFAIAAYYAHIETSPSLAELVIAAIIPLLFLTFFMVSIRLLSRHVTVVCYTGLGIWFLLGIAYVIGWIFCGGVFYSFGFFAMSIVFVYAVAVLYFLHKEEPHVLRYASFAGFGCVALVALVVISILIEDDAVSAFWPDWELPSFGKKKGKK